MDGRIAGWTGGQDTFTQAWMDVRKRKWDGGIGQVDGWMSGRETGMAEYERWMDGCMDEEVGWMDEILGDNLE